MDGGPARVVYRLGTEPENSGGPSVGRHLYWRTSKLSSCGAAGLTIEEEHAAPPAAVPDGTPADMARKAIAAATTVAQLERLRPRIDQRLKEKATAAFEADELLDLIQDKAEQLGGAVRS